jgi:hypothetical protein
MTYEIITEEDGTQTIKRTNEDGSVSFIPADEANSDYQRYLNPQAALSTPIVIDDSKS